MVARVSSNIPVDEIKAHFRHCLRSPLTWAVLVMPPLVSIGQIHQAPTNAQLFAVHILLYVAAILVLVGFLLTTGAQVFRIGLAKGVPYTVIMGGIWITGSFLYTLVHVVIFPSEGDYDHQIAHWLAQQPVAAAVILALIVHNRHAILALGRGPAAQGSDQAPPGPPALPSSAPPPPAPPPVAPPSLAPSPLASGGRIISMQAQNQYVDILRPSGHQLVRATLTEMISRQPPDSGLQVHRSWWVGLGELRGARLDAQARLVGASGAVYPVARNRLSAVKAYLAASRTA